MAEHHASPGEAALARDLRSLASLAGREHFARELYRALAQNRWRNEREGVVAAPSWTVAERLVNEVRRRDGAAALTLAQTGEEGTVSEEVDRELRALGWTSELRDPDTHDPEHDAATAGPERFRPAGTEWEREAHEAADQERLRGG